MRPTVFLAAGLSLVALACRTEGPDAPMAMHAMERAPVEMRALSAETQQQLAELRQKVAHLKTLDAAASGAWSSKLTDCMDHGALGAMGVHYGDLTRFDATLQHDAPEILMFEPQAHGAPRFVGVEYAVPFAAWTKAEPPVLFGQPLHRNEDFGLWVLHVWVGRENPSGIFTDWNPKVSCES